MPSFSPTTSSDTEWDAAYYRLEDYLRALHVVNKIHQSQLILRLLQTVATKHRENPDDSPTTLAIKECHSQSEQWFEKVLGRRDRFPVAGLLPLFLADGAEKWPASFLKEAVPADFQQTMKEHDLKVSPDLQISRMVPRPLDVNPLLDGVFHDGWEKLDAGTAVIACLIAVSIVVAIFFFIT